MGIQTEIIEGLRGAAAYLPAEQADRLRIYCDELSGCDLAAIAARCTYSARTVAGLFDRAWADDEAALDGLQRLGGAMAASTLCDAFLIAASAARRATAGALV